MSFRILDPPGNVDEKVKVLCTLNSNPSAETGDTRLKMSQIFICQLNDFKFSGSYSFGREVYVSDVMTRINTTYNDFLLWPPMMTSACQENNTDFYSRRRGTQFEDLINEQNKHFKFQFFICTMRIVKTNGSKQLKSIENSN